MTPGAGPVPGLRRGRTPHRRNRDENDETVSTCRFLVGVWGSSLRLSKYRSRSLHNVPLSPPVGPETEIDDSFGGGERHGVEGTDSFSSPFS